MPSLDNHLFVSPFALGLYLGLIFTALALYQLFRAKSELKRFKRHLSDKLEIEAETATKLKAAQESLRAENENLRLKIGALNEVPARRAEREVEIFARAEKQMLVSVPGFAGPWENAKVAAATELGAEEAGKSLPRRVFARIFATPPAARDESEPVKCLPETKE